MVVVNKLVAVTMMFASNSPVVRLLDRSPVTYSNENEVCREADPAVNKRTRKTEVSYICYNKTTKDFYTKTITKEPENGSN